MIISGGTFSVANKVSIIPQPFQNSWIEFGIASLINRSLSPTGNLINFHDSIYFTSASTIVTDIYWPYTIDPYPCIQTIPPTFSVSGNGVSLPSGNSFIWQFQNTGIVKIVSSTAYQTGSKILTVSSTLSSSGNTFTGFNTSSIAYNNQQFIDNLISGKSGTSLNQNIFSSYTANVNNMDENTFIRNTGIWTTTGLDISCRSVYSNGSDAFGTKFPITMISPRHYIGAAHVTRPSGTILNFVDANNNVYTRTVIANQNPIDDISIGILDSDLPSNIIPVQIMSGNWSNYISLQYYDADHAMQFPVIFVAQNLQMCIIEGYSISYNGTIQYLNCQYPSTKFRQNFYFSIFSGDSSDPVFMVINGKLILLTTWHYAPSSGPLTSAVYSMINSSMSYLSNLLGLGTNYQLTSPNLTGFGTF